MNPIQHALEINNGKAILLSIKKEWLDKIMAGDKVIAQACELNRIEIA